MLGASEKIALLTRQNEILMKDNKALEKENIDLHRHVNSLQLQLESTIQSSAGEEVEKTILLTGTLTPPKGNSNPNSVDIKKDSIELQSDGLHDTTVVKSQTLAVQTTPTTAICEDGISGVDFNMKVLDVTRDCASGIYKQLAAHKDRKAKISSELQAAHVENKRLKDALRELTDKKKEFTVKLESLSSFLSAPKNDTSTQLLAVENQILIMQKRKATLVKLLGTLKEGRSSFFEADINGAMEALKEIDVKLSELCSEQQSLSKAPIHFSELTQPNEKEGVDKAAEGVQKLEATINDLSHEIKTISQQQLLADLNVRELKLKHTESKERCEALEHDLRTFQTIISQLDKGSGQVIRPEVESSTKSDSPISPMNELLSGKVKEKLSSVRGMMGRMSLSSFRIPGSSFLSSEKETSSHSASSEGVGQEEQTNVDSDRGKNLCAGLPVEKWSPGFIGSVGAWARSGKRDVTFIISVRAVDSGAVAEWTVTRSFNDFKALRQKIVCDSSGWLMY